MSPHPRYQHLAKVDVLELELRGGFPIYGAFGPVPPVGRGFVRAQNALGSAPTASKMHNTQKGNRCGQRGYHLREPGTLSHRSSFDLRSKTNSGDLCRHLSHFPGTLSNCCLASPISV